MDVVITVDEKDAARMMQAVEMTLEGHNLFLFMRDNMEPFMRERARQRFQQEGDAASGDWVELADSTKSIRRNLGFPPEHPINKRTGELENFMLRGAIDHKWSPLSATMAYPGKPPTKSLREKLSTAQRGRDKKPITPKRPVAAVDMRDMAYFIQSFSFWFGREVALRSGHGGVFWI